MQINPTVVRKRKCGQCGSSTHIASNSVCPNFGRRNSSAILPSVSSSSSTASAEVFDDSASIGGDHNPDDVIENEDPSEEENNDIESSDSAPNLDQPSIPLVQEVWTEIDMVPIDVFDPKDYITVVGNDPGARNIPDGVKHSKSPFDVWSLFITPDIIRTLWENTVSFSHSLNQRRKPIELGEIYAFIGIVLFMGINVVGNRKYLFSDSTPLHSKFVSDTFSKRRFDWILRCFHWIDTTKFTDQEKSVKNKTDHFWRVGSFLEQLAVSFRHFYKPGCWIDVDEQCIPFKGRHPSKCYNPNKPNKWHLKLFCMNDSQSHYTVNFFAYQGKDERRPPGMSATAYPPIRLLDHDEYKHMGYKFFSDNWYTQIELCDVFNDWGIDADGTIKTNRAGLYKEGILPYKGRNVKERGYCRQYKLERPGYKPLYMISWMDSKPVHMLSTFESKLTTCTRNSRDQNGVYRQLQLPQPDVIKLYNKGMGGTDGVDQKLEAYRTNLKTKAWPPKVIFHGIQLAQVNAHVIYKQIHNLDAKSENFTLLDFSLTLIHELVSRKNHIEDGEASDDSQDNASDNSSASDDIIVSKTARARTPPRKRGKFAHFDRLLAHNSRKEGSDHFPAHVGHRTNGSKDMRRKCRICYKKTPYKCISIYCIDMHFCVDNNSYKGKSCFTYYHTCTDDELEASNEKVGL